MDTTTTMSTSERCIFSTTGVVVMRFDELKRQWLESNGSLGRPNGQPTNVAKIISDPTPGRLSYRILVHSEPGEVLAHSVIVPPFKHTKQTEIFVQWHDQQHSCHLGLSFSRREDADNFHQCVCSALDVLAAATTASLRPNRPHLSAQAPPTPPRQTSVRPTGALGTPPTSGVLPLDHNQWDDGSPVNDHYQTVQIGNSLQPSMSRDSTLSSRSNASGRSNEGPYAVAMPANSIISMADAMVHTNRGSSQPPGATVSTPLSPYGAQLVASSVGRLAHPNSSPLLYRSETLPTNGVVVGHPAVSSHLRSPAAGNFFSDASSPRQGVAVSMAGVAYTHQLSLDTNGPSPSSMAGNGSAVTPSPSQSSSNSLGLPPSSLAPPPLPSAVPSVIPVAPPAPCLLSKQPQQRVMSGRRPSMVAENVGYGPASRANGPAPTLVRNGSSASATKSEMETKPNGGNGNKSAGTDGLMTELAGALARRRSSSSAAIKVPELNGRNEMLNEIHSVFAARRSRAGTMGNDGAGDEKDSPTASICSATTSTSAGSSGYESGSRSVSKFSLDKTGAGLGGSAVDSEQTTVPAGSVALKAKALANAELDSPKSMSRRRSRDEGTGSIGSAASATSGLSSSGVSGSNGSIPTALFGANGLAGGAGIGAVPAAGVHSQGLVGSAGSVVTMSDLESAKQDILREIRKEMQSLKSELFDYLRKELWRK